MIGDGLDCLAKRNNIFTLLELANYTYMYIPTY